jgi:hypothetical protein
MLRFLESCLSVVIGITLCAWLVLAYGMMEGEEWAFRLTSSMQRGSRLGDWFPLVFILGVPAVILAIVGLFNRFRPSKAD